jgi:hypothetical protein
MMIELGKHHIYLTHMRRIIIKKINRSREIPEQSGKFA